MEDVMQYLRLLLVIVIILVCHSIAGAETYEIYNTEYLPSKTYAVSLENFIEKDLGGKIPEEYYCFGICSSNINIVFFKKNNKVEWLWSRKSDWWVLDGRLDNKGWIVKYDETRQLIGFDSVQVALERIRYEEVRSAPEVPNDTYIRENTRKLLKRMKKGEND
jgi:hypothetical protein